MQMGSAAGSEDTVKVCLKTTRTHRRNLIVNMMSFRNPWGSWKLRLVIKVVVESWELRLCCNSKFIVYRRESSAWRILPSLVQYDITKKNKKLGFNHNLRCKLSTKALFRFFLERTLYGRLDSTSTELQTYYRLYPSNLGGLGLVSRLLDTCVVTRWLTSDT